MNWTPICNLDDLAPNTGVCAKFHGKQVAIFRDGSSEQLYAVGNYDPIGKANVLSRGLIAQLGEHLTVASPLYKHHYDLRTGVCLEDDSVTIPVFGVRVSDGRVALSDQG